MDSWAIVNILLAIIGSGLLLALGVLKGELQRINVKLDNCATKTDIGRVEKRCDEQDAQILSLAQTLSLLQGQHFQITRSNT